MPTPSINLVKSSDGTGDAAVATVQTLRAPGASTILVDTVDNIPATFMGSMGKPHTFIDPVTSETITVISEATAVDFFGHVSSTHLEIDGISPGYTDTRGSEVGDIVIIKPTSDWANNIAALLAVSHNDDGSLNGTAVRTALGQSAALGAGWTTLGNNPNTITYNGNRSYTCVFNAVDLTGSLSNGMRMLFSRNTAAPTKCTSLNGTTQYFSKTSPAGMTFTDDFTVSAWIKLSSYASGGIVSRYNGTNGWVFSVDSSGRLLLQGVNGGVSNTRYLQTYQSIPLNKWVHVAASLDMSGFTTTTCKAMIDGVDVPVSLISGGTNPTALVQAGNLEIGSFNAGSFFPGKIAQVAIFTGNASTITQTILRSYMSQGLTGTETSLISAYSFNNSINDLSAASNNLTANGSATATNTDSPFALGATAGLLEYGIITGVSFSTNTTITVQVPEGCALPTTGTITTSSYSAMKAPYGFPTQKEKWNVGLYIITGVNSSGTTNATVYNPGGLNLNIPIGSWHRKDNIAAQFTNSGTVFDNQISVSSSPSALGNVVHRQYLSNYTAGGGLVLTRATFDEYLNLSSATPYYPLLYVGASVTQMDIRSLAGGNMPSTIIAECAYL